MAKNYSKKIIKQTRSDVNLQVKPIKINMHVNTDTKLSYFMVVPISIPDVSSFESYGEYDETQVYCIDHYDEQRDAVLCRSLGRFFAHQVYVPFSVISANKNYVYLVDITIADQSLIK